MSDIQFANCVLQILQTNRCCALPTHQQAEIDLWMDKLVVTFKCQLESYSQSLPMQNTKLTAAVMSVTIQLLCWT